MKAFYSWKTIQDNNTNFSKNVTYFYENKIHHNIDDWNSLYEELFINVEIEFNTDLVNFNDYLIENEKIGALILCEGDSKFIYKSELIEINNTNFIINCKLPAGFCGEKLKIDLFIVSIETEDSKSYRLPGSIISKISILDSINIDKGTWFPIEYCEGDGKLFIKWNIATLDELELEIASSLLIQVDKNHPLAKNLDENQELQKMIELNIFQGLSRKLFSDSIFEEISEKYLNNYEWEPKSIGFIFNFILNEIVNNSGISNLKNLKEYFYNSPQEIDMYIDRIYSNLLTK